MNLQIDTENSSQVSKYLLEVAAVQLNIENPFTWASGWKSPIYCDNRLTLSFPHVRSFITKCLTEGVKKYYPDTEVIAGVATAGIPQGALVAAALDLPFVYVRSKAKSHGMTNLIEGKIEPGQKCVVIEDLVSTGGSSLKAVSDLINAGGNVIGMAAIFTYGFEKAKENFQKANIDLFCLSTYSAMIETAIEIGYIPANATETLQKWREAPERWGY